MDVLGVGDIDVDIYLEVDHIPSRDEKILAKSVRFYPGGMVGNFLVSLSRLGTKCGFHWPVGLDEFGQIAMKDLIENNVDVQYVVTKENGRTYFCVVMLDRSGEKSLVVAPTDCLAPEVDDISSRAIKSARHLHTNIHGKGQIKAIQIAHKYQVSISVDFEPDSVKGNDSLDEVLSLTDIAFINQNALSYMSSCGELEKAANDVLTRGPSIVCITLGAKGSLLLSKAEPHPIRVKSFDIPVVDTTGAGDCFAAGFIHGYLNGWSLQFTGVFASATAALKIMSTGGHTGSPSFEEVLLFLQEKNVNIPNYVI